MGAAYCGMVIQATLPPPRRISREFSMPMMREQLGQGSLGHAVAGVVEQRQDDGRVAGVVVDVRRTDLRAGLAGVGGVVLIEPFGLLGRPLQHARLRQLVDLQLAALGVAGAAQDVVGLLVDFPLRVVAVVRPLHHHHTGTDEAGQVVDMTIGFVELAAARQPDHLLGAQVVVQPTGHLILAQVSVTVAVEQALLGGQQDALAIGLDAAHLSDEGRTVAIKTFDLEDLLRNLIVLVPRVVEAAIETAVSVELEVHTAHFTALVIHQKGRAAVAEPGVVAGHFHHPHMRRQLTTSIGVLTGRGAHGHRLATGDGADDIDPDLLRWLGTVAPYVGTLRPAEPAARFGFKFTGQAEAVGFGQGGQGTGHC